MDRMRAALFFLMLLSGMAVAAGMYRWTDEHGKIHYTDTPPPLTARTAEERKLGDKPGSGPVPYEIQQAVKKYPVTLFNSDCGAACVDAKALLGKRGVPFTEKIPEKNPTDAEALRKMTGGELLVPVLVVGTDTVKGFEEGQWNAMLDMAGYPKTSHLSRLPARPAPVAGAGAPEPAIPAPLPGTARR